MYLSDAFYNNLPNLVTSFATLIGAIGGFYVLYKGQKKAAQTAEDVKSTLVHNRAVTESKLDNIHAIVDGAHSTTLHLAAELANHVATLTNAPSDIQVAIEANKAADDHDENTKNVVEV